MPDAGPCYLEILIGCKAGHSNFVPIYRDPGSWEAMSGRGFTRFARRKIVNCCQVPWVSRMIRLRWWMGDVLWLITTIWGVSVKFADGAGPSMNSRCWHGLTLCSGGSMGGRIHNYPLNMANSQCRWKKIQALAGHREYDDGTKYEKASYRLPVEVTYRHWSFPRILQRRFETFMANF